MLWEGICLVYLFILVKAHFRKWPAFCLTGKFSFKIASHEGLKDPEHFGTQCHKMKNVSQLSIQQNVQQPPPPPPNQPYKKPQTYVE